METQQKSFEIEDQDIHLADRQHFTLNAEQWQALHDALDAPPQHSPRLARLRREPSVFERGEVDGL